MLTATNDTFSGNMAIDGGGIFDEMVLALSNSALSGNSARRGGGMTTFGDDSLSNVTFSGNSAHVGGGIAALWHLNLSNATLSGNSARYGGGLYTGSPTTVLSSTFSGNSASISGGGIYNAETAIVTGTTLYANTAITSGGGIDNQHILVLTNDTLSGNSAGMGGGLANLGNNGVRSASLWNVTLSGNSATTGGALDIGAGFTTLLKNTIVADSLAGGNCSGAPITASQYDISSDNTCALAGPGDRNNLDVRLTALGNYGGPTLVHMLKLGSPAIDGVVGSDAPSTDQRSLPRPQGGGYDIGAVERQPTDSDLAPRLYLPLIRR